MIEPVSKRPLVDGGRALLRRLLVYMKPYRLQMAGTLVLIMSGSLCMNYMPVIIQQIIDAYLMNESHALGEAARFDGLLRASLTALGFAITGTALFGIHGLWMAWIGQRIVRDIRRDVYRKALSLSTDYFNRTPVGRLLTRTTSDVEAVQRFVTEGIVGSISDVFMLFTVIGFMLYINRFLALVMFLMFPPLLVVFIVMNRGLFGAHRKIREAQSAQNAFLQENLSGMGTIQLFNREAYSREQFDQKNRAMREAQLDESLWSSRYFPMLEAVLSASTILVLAGGSMAMMGHRYGVTLGVLVGFLAYVRDFFRPLNSLSQKATGMQEALSAAERLATLLDEESVIPEPELPAEPPTLKGHIAFENVWFAYEDKNWVLKDLSFTIPPGVFTAVVGATGAGKTSVITCLLRLFDIQRGRITLDGVDLRDYRKRDLRSRLGIVMQEPVIFSQTIFENIRLFDDRITLEQVEEAARYVHAHPFIKKLPQGYHTPLEERGGSLSTGEKQLLALARILVHNPEVVIMLDEATANIDTETELIIQDAFQKVMKGRTSIVIAHRLSTIQHADCILVMKEGRLIGEGPHRELLETCSYYRRLYDFLSYESNG